VLLSAQTGIGKTNLCLAIAIAIAAGVDFLHWRCPSPRRVLFIDGEMSERLMKQRIEDALRRVGDDPEVQRRVRENLFVLNRANFPDLPPLDTEAGRKYMDRTSYRATPPKRPHCLIAAGPAVMTFRRCPGCRVCEARPPRSRYTGPPGSG
jgi:AAA domain